MQRERGRDKEKSG
ncbi:hypothetical protein MIMGU_mgv1a0027262mg, partial [Erythranthe guttata]